MTKPFTHAYALLIGVGQSAYTDWSLPVTVHDIQALKSVLVDPNLCAYPDDADHIRLLHDAGATRDAILDGLRWLKERAAADLQATVVLYFSGHGWLEHASGRYFLIPHDIKPFNIPQSALPAEDFTAGLHAIPAQRLLVIVDSCHAAGIAKDEPVVQLPPNLTQAALPKGLADTLAQGTGHAIFTSSRGEERSWVRADGALSLYTHHLLEALQGAGNHPGDTQVTLSAVMRHLSRSVPQTAQQMGRTQTPYYKFETEDFPIAMLLGGKGLPTGGWDAVAPEAAATTERIVQQITLTGNGAINTGSGNALGAGAVQNTGSVGGDIVTGTQTTTFDQRGQNVENQTNVAGDVITTHHSEGGMFLSSVNAKNIIGRDGIINANQQDSDLQAFALAFNKIYQQVAQKPELPPQEKADIKEEIQEVETELKKGEDASASFIERRLRNIGRMAPDILEVVLTTFANPLLGLGMVAKRIADKMKAEADPAAG